MEKGGGKTRPLGIPAVRDRVAQEVLRRLLEPLFEPLFHDKSYGFRPQRSCHFGRGIESLTPKICNGDQFRC
ncbi:MAG: reverse transcriptase domain-containing protein [Planctomycetota bacterium]|nr:reverse transcriptase domain-containing protein [Planctomycetota bacterium]